MTMTKYVLIYRLILPVWLCVISLYCLFYSDNERPYSSTGHGKSTCPIALMNEYRCRTSR